jgi:hypothetical protein
MVFYGGVYYAYLQVKETAGGDMSNEQRTPSKGDWYGPGEGEFR